MISRWAPDRRELLFAGAVAVLAVAEAVTATPGHRAATAAVLVPVAVTLAWRVSLPVVPVSAAAIAAPTLSVAGVPSNKTLTMLIAVVVTAYSLGAHAPRRALAPGAALLAAAAVASVVLDHRSLAANVPFALLVTLAPAAMGTTMRLRHDYAIAMRERATLIARHSEEATAQAVAAERARIARELHDVIAHSLTVIGLQAGGVRRLLRQDQTRERDALELVERTTRQAHEEMRHLLSLMRPDDAGEQLTPQPGLSQLPALVQNARESGLDVTVEQSGDLDALPRGVDLAAYRIVQEALTNTRKHSRATSVCVSLHAEPGSLRISIADPGPSVPGPSTGGLGLVGIRERAALYDGELHAGATPAGGFAVTTTLSYRKQP